MNLQSYIVLYKTPDCLAADPPLGFRCLAEDADHAEEQFDNAYEYDDCEIVWVTETHDYQAALVDYWTTDDVLLELGVTHA